MNKLQEKEFQILKAVIEICDKLDLKYYLVCGSALGAAKYQGFIPWDDDIDIGLFREDYEKFCMNAQKMLPEYYFLQNNKTDKYFPALYSKVRDSRTTYIEKGVSDLKIHHGVYIDVFPLDGYPDDKKEIWKLELKKEFLKYCLFCVFDKNPDITWKAKALRVVGRGLGLHKRTNQIVGRIDRLITQYPTHNSTLICNHGNWQGRLEYASKEQYGEGYDTEFEGIRVRIPEKYDEYLTQKYGDWRAELAEEKKKGHHAYLVCDLNHSYMEYVKK